MCLADVLNLFQETLHKAEIQKLSQSLLIHPTQMKSKTIGIFDH